MKYALIHLIVLLAVLAGLAALAAWSAREKGPALRPKRNGLRRRWRKVYLLPVGIHRLTGWLPGQRCRPTVQFANIGEGTYAKGQKSYIPDAATGGRYLLYKKGSDVDHCAICGAGDDPLGPSDDQAGADSVPITINMLGAFEGTVRVVTDGTVADGDYVKCAANGQVTKAASGDLSFGRARISSDMSANAGETITIIGALPAKYAF